MPDEFKFPPECGHTVPDMACEHCQKAALEVLGVEVAKPFTISASGPIADTFGDVIVPDVIGEIEAWRVWRVLDPYGSPQLQSLGAGGRKHASIWTPQKIMEAYCDREHVVPNERCSCGFYAAKTREHLLEMSYHRGFDFDDPTDVLVIGTVAMQGKIIPGTQGWRAQRARPVSVEVPFSRWRVVKPLAARYPGVQVKLANFLRETKGVKH